MNGQIHKTIITCLVRIEISKELSCLQRGGAGTLGCQLGEIGRGCGARITSQVPSCKGRPQTKVAACKSSGANDAHPDAAEHVGFVVGRFVVWACGPEGRHHRSGHDTVRGEGLGQVARSVDLVLQSFFVAKVENAPQCLMQPFPLNFIHGVADSSDVDFLGGTCFLDSPMEFLGSCNQLRTRRLCPCENDRLGHRQNHLEIVRGERQIIGLNQLISLQTQYWHLGEM